MADREIEIGSTWREPGSSVRFTVVRTDEQMVWVKRADSPKKILANAAGGHMVARSEFAGVLKPEPESSRFNFMLYVDRPEGDPHELGYWASYEWERDGWHEAAS